jgi:hypothetical protein
MTPVLVDLNRYKLGDLQIEFKKSFIKSYNTLPNTQSYIGYSLLPNTNDIYLPTEINRNDSTSYIKLKGRDLWLHTDNNNNFYFDIIRKESFYYRQPLVVWFQYNKGEEMIMRKFFGKGLYSNSDIINGGINNIMYINYKQLNGQIYMNWTKDINSATKIIIEKPTSADAMWKSKVVINKYGLI